VKRVTVETISFCLLPIPEQLCEYRLRDRSTPNLIHRC